MCEWVEQRVMGVGIGAHPPRACARLRFSAPLAHCGSGVKSLHFSPSRSPRPRPRCMHAPTCGVRCFRALLIVAVTSTCRLPA